MAATFYGTATPPQRALQTSPVLWTAFVNNLANVTILGEVHWETIGFTDFGSNVLKGPGALNPWNSPVAWTLFITREFPTLFGSGDLQAVDADGLSFSGMAGSGFFISEIKPSHVYRRKRSRLRARKRIL